MQEVSRGNFTSEEFWYFLSFVISVSNALWNNMLQPVGSKSQVWNKTFETFLCPTVENPYIYTIKNSRRD